MSSGQRRTLTQIITNMVGEYLFGLPSDEDRPESKGLDMRTRIVSEKQMKAITYLGTVGYAFGSDLALDVKDMLERLFISHNGLGREEGVNTLRQNFPRKVEVDKGFDDVTSQS